MREIVIKSIENDRKHHKNAKKEYSKEVQESRYRYVTEKISNLSLINNQNKICLIFGMGKHPKSTYRELEKLSGIRVVWYDSLFSKWLKPVSFFIASYEGLVEITDREKLPLVFNRLANMSMVGLYYFSRDLENKFVETIKKEKYSSYGDTIVQEDPEYFHH